MVRNEIVSLTPDIKRLFSAQLSSPFIFFVILDITCLRLLFESLSNIIFGRHHILRYESDDEHFVYQFTTIKAMESITESFPQSILQTYVMLVLEDYTALTISSILISFLSLSMIVLKLESFKELSIIGRFIGILFLAMQILVRILFIGVFGAIFRGYIFLFLGIEFLVTFIITGNGVVRTYRKEKSIFALIFYILVTIGNTFVFLLSDISDANNIPFLDVKKNVFGILFLMKFELSNLTLLILSYFFWRSAFVSNIALLIMEVVAFVIWNIFLITWTLMYTKSRSDKRISRVF